MTTHVTAIYENGVLRPTEPLPLKNGDRIQFSVEMPSTRSALNDAQQRIREAKTFDEWIAAANLAAELEPNDNADFLESLNETRRRTGERLLFPPERKGIDW